MDRQLVPHEPEGGIGLMYTLAGVVGVIATGGLGSARYRRLSGAPSSRLSASIRATMR